MASNSTGFIQKKGNLLYGMELLRGLAAIAVLILHYQHFYYLSPILKATDADRLSQPFWGQLTIIYTHGALGVQVFWVVSGVVLSCVYLGMASCDNFFLNRFSRIYPLHLITLLFLVVLQKISISHSGHAQIYDHNSLANFFLHVLFLVGFRGDTNYGFNGVVWSVSVEIALYVSFYFFLKVSRYRITLTTGILLTFALLDRFFPSMQVLECGKYFFLGVLLFLLRNTSQQYLLIFALGAFVLQYFFTNQRIFLLITTLVAIVLYAEFILRTLPRLALVVVEKLGATSYALYLLHIPVQVALLLVLDFFGIDRKLVASDYRFFLSYFVFLFLFALLIHRFIELPARDRLRSKFKRVSS